MISHGLRSCVLLILLLSSCTVIDDWNAMIEAQRKAKELTLLQSAKGACEKYGFKPGTDSFAQCIQTEINEIKTRETIAAEASSTRSTIESEAASTRAAIEKADKKKKKKKD